MKRALSMLAAGLMIAALSGCACDQSSYIQRGGEGMAGMMRGSCRRAPNLCRPCRLGRGGEEAFVPGPPSGTVTYPYYTIRGPRDFLASNPPSIGP